MRSIIVSFFLMPLSVAFAKDSGEQGIGYPANTKEEFVFEPALFRGERFSQSTLQRLTKPGSIVPGDYRVDVYVNNHFVATQRIQFDAQPDGSVTPCLPADLVISAQIDSKIASDEISPSACYLLSQVVVGGSSKLDVVRLRLDLSIPQNQLKKIPRGFVNPDDLDAGSTLGFINYLTNYYHVSWSGTGSQRQDSAWVSLNGGFNLGMWQYRQLSNVRWSNNTGTDWTRVQSYLQRPLPTLNSQMALGELTTRGQLFSGLSYKGLSLSTDERMRPDSQRGFAPVVRGTAASNAKVTIFQNGKQLYQTNVAPGPFEISDLYPTSYNGDLTVEVTEADGSVSRFSIPFSAVPESMRPGNSRYQFALGRTNNSGDNALFSDLTWQYGFTNALTGNSGLRLSDSYQSATVGGVYGSYFGATGLGLTYSHAQLPYSGYTDGWMAYLSWSKTLQPTGTSITLAGYRYSTSGYRDLSDVLGLRSAGKRGTEWESSTYRQQSRFTVSLSQNLSHWGNLYLSGAVQNYRNGRRSETQLQSAYSNNFSNGTSYTLSISRQYSSQSYDAGKSQTMTALSISIPLGSERNTTTLNNTLTRSSDGGSQYQSSVAGMIDDAQTLSYNVGIQRDQPSHTTVINGGMQKRTPLLNFGMNASRSADYWQASGNAQGAVALHSGGVTFGPYLSDTFALVEAKGASGARIFNSQQSTIDSNGYALLPSITPYRYSQITLDPQGMEGNAELVENEQRVAPVAGAAVKLVFRTRTGNALLIKTRMPNGEVIPPGSDVLDREGVVIGMVGQEGQIYVRTEQTEGELFVNWGEEPQERCSFPYKIPEAKSTHPLIKLTSICTH